MLKQILRTLFAKSQTLPSTPKQTHCPNILGNRISSILAMSPGLPLCQQRLHSSTSLRRLKIGYNPKVSTLFSKTFFLSPSVVLRNFRHSGSSGNHNGFNTSRAIPYSLAVLGICHAADESTSSDQTPEIADSQETSPPQSNDRLASVDWLNENRKNHTLTESWLLQMGLKNAGDGKFKLNEKNGFYARLTPNGQLKWDCDCRISSHEVKEIVLFTCMQLRSLLINTGSHGDEEGETVVGQIELGDAKFTK